MLGDIETDNLAAVVGREHHEPGGSSSITIESALAVAGMIIMNNPNNLCNCRNRWFHDHTS